MNKAATDLQTGFESATLAWLEHTKAGLEAILATMRYLCKFAGISPSDKKAIELKIATIFQQLADIEEQIAWVKAGNMKVCVRCGNTLGFFNLEIHAFCQVCEGQPTN